MTMAWNKSRALIPGLVVVLSIVLVSYYVTGHTSMGMGDLPESSISPVLLAIVFGLLIRNTTGVHAGLESGIQFGLKVVLPFSIALLGTRLSLGVVTDIGLHSLPIIAACVLTALVVSLVLCSRYAVSRRLATLIAVGTSICGATAIVASTPVIGAKKEETSYAVICVALFGTVAMILYPTIGSMLFEGEPLKVGLFLGTAIHDTSQVIGAGLLYEQQFGDTAVLDAAVVAKMTRNLFMLLVIPALSLVSQQDRSAGVPKQPLYRLIPTFLFGFLIMSLLRTVGDQSSHPFGFLSQEQWNYAMSAAKQVAEKGLVIAMACVGLRAAVSDVRKIGPVPFIIGLLSALSVGAVSLVLVKAYY